MREALVGLVGEMSALDATGEVGTECDVEDAECEGRRER